MKKEILYVDDEPINLKLFKIIFEDECNVHIAKSGKEGLQILQNNIGIQVVFSDFKMPEMDGIEFINKAITINKDVNYYLLTGYDITNEISSALETNTIGGCLKKPFNKEEIQQKIG